MIFKEGHNELVNKDGAIFRMDEHERPYYLRPSVNDTVSSDSMNLTCDIKPWHQLVHPDLAGPTEPHSQEGYRIRIFGLDCYTYMHDQKKLDPKGEK